MNIERQKCLACPSVVPMSYVWPSPQPDPAVEAVIGNFQYCRNCGWSGDVRTHKQIRIKRLSSNHLLINGAIYPDVRTWLIATGQIPKPLAQS